jgi:hypothetical protein
MHSEDGITGNAIWGRRAGLAEDNLRKSHCSNDGKQRDVSYEPSLE